MCTDATVTTGFRAVFGSGRGLVRKTAALAYEGKEWAVSLKTLIPSGLQPGETLLLAAKSGTGKTILALQLLTSIAVVGQSCVFDSYVLDATRFWKLIARQMLVVDQWPEDLVQYESVRRHLNFHKSSTTTTWRETLTLMDYHAVCVIDSLDFMAKGRDINLLLSELSARARATGCALIVLHMLPKQISAEVDPTDYLQPMSGFNLDPTLSTHMGVLWRPPQLDFDLQNKQFYEHVAFRLMRTPKEESVEMRFDRECLRFLLPVPHQPIE